MDEFRGKSKSLLSDYHLRAIGAVVVNWSTIEIVMELFILGLYEVPPDRDLVMTSNLSFQNKLTILRVLATKEGIKEPAEAKSFANLLDRIEKAVRNEMLSLMAGGPPATLKDWLGEWQSACVADG